MNKFGKFSLGLLFAAMLFITISAVAQDFAPLGIDAGFNCEGEFHARGTGGSGNYSVFSFEADSGAYFVSVSDNVTGERVSNRYEFSKCEDSNVPNIGSWEVYPVVCQTPDHGNINLPFDQEHGFIATVGGEEILMFAGLNSNGEVVVRSDTPSAFVEGIIMVLGDQPGPEYEFLMMGNDWSDGFAKGCVRMHPDE